MMKLTNFETSDLSGINHILFHQMTLEAETVKELLKTCNISFVLEGINRLQSTLICELKDSYVQQSQRYVTLSPDGYTLPALRKEDAEKARNLMEKAFHLYEEMSVLKEEFKGRPKREHYLHGIPIEDARYILPLAVKTNITVSMTGDKLYDWFKMMKHPDNQKLFSEIHDALLSFLPEFLGLWLQSQPYGYERNAVLMNYYRKDLCKITSESPVVLLHAFSEPELKVGVGALTSTKATAPSEVLLEWKEEAPVKSREVMNRVLGYGHTAISEQHRTTFGMMFSLVTYHQQVRHRLPATYRESWNNILQSFSRPVIIPETVCEGGFRTNYMELVEEFKKFQQYLANQYEDGEWRYFLLNCQQVKVITSTNARMDCEMLKERICNNAQWEIHKIACMKLHELRKQSGTLYKHAVPSCVYGVCKEGKLTCGRAQEMREQYYTED